MTSAYDRVFFALRRQAMTMAAFWLAGVGILSWMEVTGVGSSSFFFWVRSTISLLATLSLGHSTVKLGWAVWNFGSMLPIFSKKMLLMFPKMARARSETAKIVVHVGLASIAAMLYATFSVLSMVPLFFYFLSVALVIFLRIILPPAAIYLASSTDDRLKLLFALQMRAFVGVTGLLDLSESLDGDVQSSLKNPIFLMMLYDSRTREDSDWTEVVEQMMDIVPLIFLDTRDTTPGVLCEVKKIFERDITAKTGFICDEQGTCPALNIAATTERVLDSSIKISQQRLLTDIRGLVWKARLQNDGNRNDKRTLG
ncbi:hypothetical protein [Paraburkholderia hospita]|uniref:hypothetical protein n=1 Tax=Paraburkholderia hospita TaxID=169430 RepID=UPI000B6D4C97|nr:hypothetical protein [Paraburkholderia hospita]OUL97140.1 hypothetical protein CA601_00790 [Paraburkholderia hospita]